MRVFLDANVLFYCSKKSSSVAEAIEILSHKTELFTSDLALEEARRNIEAKRPAWIEDFGKIISQGSLLPTVFRSLPVDLAEKDIPILSSAIAAKCDYFVTGDKRHFGHLFDESVLGVRIVSLLGLTEILLTQDEK